MIPIEVLQSVYLIRYGNASASCFTIENDQKQYLVTARHLFYSDKELRNHPLKDTFDIPKVELLIFRDNTWKKLKGSVYFNDNIHIDIAVIELNKSVLPNISLIINYKNLDFGQDVYFLGFPLGLQTWLMYSTSPFPLPFVKKAIVAGMTIGNDGDSITYLDTQSNPGFSGGPVIFKQPGDDQFQICAVITGAYLDWSDSDTAKINISYAEDSGLAFVTHISHLEGILNRIKGNKT